MTTERTKHICSNETAAVSSDVLVTTLIQMSLVLYLGGRTVDPPMDSGCLRSIRAGEGMTACFRWWGGDSDG